MPINPDERCPTCGHRSKPLTRWMRPQWAALLKRVYDDHGQEWVHVRREYSLLLSQMNNDWSFLHHFGLMLHSRSETTDRTHSGEWRVTDLGKDFVNSVARVPDYLVVQFNQVQEVSPNEVSFSDVMRQKWKFDLQEILRVPRELIEAVDWDSEPLWRRARRSA